MRRIEQKSLAVIFVLANTLTLSGCVSFPPRCDPNPHVAVEYKCSTLLPGANEALFIKKVTQFETKPYEVWDFPFPPITHWAFHDEAVWTRLFICSANAKTGEKKVIREWPSGLGDPQGPFRVSRPLRQAVYLLSGIDWQDFKIVVMNLDTFEWRFIRHPNPPYSAPSAASLELSPDEKEFAVAIHTKYTTNARTPHVDGVAIYDFEGKIRFLPTDEPPSIIWWMQKRNLIRVKMITKCATVDPHSLLIIDEGNRFEYESVPRSETEAPFDAQYGSRTVNLGTPGSHKGRLSPSKAATLW